jgi:hypothetical protein
MTENTNATRAISRPHAIQTCGIISNITRDVDFPATLMDALWYLIVIYLFIRALSYTCQRISFYAASSLFKSALFGTQ